MRFLRILGKIIMVLLILITLVTGLFPVTGILLLMLIVDLIVDSIRNNNHNRR